jgi:hypothetical protein
MLRLHQKVNPERSVRVSTSVSFAVPIECHSVLVTLSTAANCMAIMR